MHIYQNLKYYIYYRLSLRCAPRRPPLHHRVQGAKSIGERGWARLQDDRRFDLVELAVAHRRHVGPAGASGHSLRAKALAAPGSEDDVGRAARNLAGIGEDAAFGERARGALREHVIAPRDCDELAHPADA